MIVESFAGVAIPKREDYGTDDEYRTAIREWREKNPDEYAKIRNAGIERGDIEPVLVHPESDEYAEIWNRTMGKKAWYKNPLVWAAAAAAAAFSFMG